MKTILILGRNSSLNNIFDSIHAQETISRLTKIELDTTWRPWREFLFKYRNNAFELFFNRKSRKLIEDGHVFNPDRYVPVHAICLQTLLHYYAVLVFCLKGNVIYYRGDI